MKKQQNKIDEYFREALQDHKVVPSEAAKAAFLKEAATLEGSGKSNKYWYFYLPAVILLGLFVTGFFFLRSNHKITKTSSVISNSDHNKKTTSIKSAQHPDNIVAEKQEMASLTDFIQKTNNTHPQDRDKKNVTPGNFTRVKRNEFTRPAPSLPTNEISTAVNTSSETKTITPVAELKSPVSIQAEEKVSAKNEMLYSPPARSADTLTTDKTTNTAPITGAAQVPENWNVTLGGYYAPEWMFNTLEGEKYVNNFGIEGTFHLGIYSIRTGAGLSITKGTNELSINYNDYLGHYNRLDSIYFTWDATHTKLLPTYYFSNENVWDSLMKMANARVVKRYTYLQIPLILGYDFWQNEHFSLGLRAGPILSVLLKTEVLSDNYDPGMNKIILINRIAPERIQTNWQFLGGFNATYHFSRRFGIELEPEIRYYFNSVYEKTGNDKKPWSAGIHAAFIVIL